METKAAKKLDADSIMSILDTCYQKAVNGIERVSPPVEKLAEDYLNKYQDPSEAARNMISNQII